MQSCICSYNIVCIYILPALLSIKKLSYHTIKIYIYFLCLHLLRADDDFGVILGE